jgi:threonine dehydrogenase-like Zn-dependent dehydrogenase
MLGLVFDGSLHVRADLPEPVPRPGEALVSVRVAGVCDTDLQIVRGYMGFRGVLGHEFVGEVLASDDPRWLGARVVADINAGCGVCEDCTTRDGHHCASRTVLGIAGRAGAMAERLVIPERNLVAVPAGLSDRAAVFAEPLAAAIHVLDGLEPGTRRVAVVGDGKLGLLVCAALRGHDLDVTLIGHHEDKLALAGALGVQTRMDVQGIERSFEAVVEASGNRTGLATAMRLVAPRGTIVLKTTVGSAYEIDLAPLVIDEVRVVGSRCGDVRQAVTMLEAGTVHPETWVEAVYPLSQAVQAMEHAGRRGARKVLVAIA